MNLQVEKRLEAQLAYPGPYIQLALAFALMGLYPITGSWATEGWSQSLGFFATVFIGVDAISRILRWTITSMMEGRKSAKEKIEKYKRERRESIEKRERKEKS